MEAGAGADPPEPSLPLPAWPRIDTAVLDRFERRDGFLVVPNVLPHELVMGIKDEFAKVAGRCKKPLEPAFKALGSAAAMAALRQSCQGSHAFGLPGLPVDTIGHGLHNDESSLIHRTVSDPGFASFAAQFISLPVVCMSKGVLKPARVGSKVPPHADDQYFWTSPPSGVTFWFALDDADESNGCIEVLEGSHLAYHPGQRFAGGGEGGRAQWLPVPAEPEGARVTMPLGKKADALSWVFTPVTAGSLIVMHHGLMHRSAGNSSALERRALTIHLVDGACEWDASRCWIPSSALRPLAIAHPVLRHPTESFPE